MRKLVIIKPVRLQGHRDDARTSCEHLASPLAVSLGITPKPIRSLTNAQVQSYCIATIHAHRKAITHLLPSTFTSRIIHQDGIIKVEKDRLRLLRQGAYAIKVDTHVEISIQEMDDARHSLHGRSLKKA